MPAQENLDPIGHDSAMQELRTEVNSLFEVGKPTENPASSTASDVPIDADLHKLYLPLIGRRQAGTHRMVLGALLTLSLVVLSATAFYALNETSRGARQVAASGQSLMQSQRLAKAVSVAMFGSAPAFDELKDSSEVLGRNVRGLKDGDSALSLDPVPNEMMPDVEAVYALVEKAEKNAGVVFSQKKNLTEVGAALHEVGRQSADLLDVTESISSLKLQKKAASAEIAASGQLVMLTQRIGKSASEFLTVGGISPEAVFLLGRDLNTFKEIAQGLLEGSSTLHLSATKDETIVEQLNALLKQYDQMRVKAQAILGNLQGIVVAREAHNAINADSENLRRGLEKLQVELTQKAALNPASLTVLVVFAVLSLLLASGLAWLQIMESQSMQKLAEVRRRQAEDEQVNAKRVNDATQAAILRLMNELANVADGDLTQQATVTEDITGAIADSVNYTVEELRQLVGNVQSTVAQVAQTSIKVETTSEDLLTKSTQQMGEIRRTGQSVLDMAQRINQVSSQAQESAQVARQSLQAADTGLNAVQRAIGGMNAIRDQIQDTSKRIKRLGESSQQIGEITELISDITEQTNILALNASIQAASAGEAGRGFSVVAEEVQRLAERSAEATRQIATLVRTIQSDTQDTVAAMERSTRGVVDGAQLTDNAGGALAEINDVSRRLAELIMEISQRAQNEAALAGQLANDIGHIFEVTEQTSSGTQRTVQEVRELAAVSEKLRQSVSRFKIL